MELAADRTLTGEIKLMMRKIMPLVIVAMLAAPAWAEPIVLQRKFKLDEVDTYKVSTTWTLKMPGVPGTPPSTDVDETMTMRQRVLDVLPDGSAKVRTYILVKQITGPAEATKAISKMKPMTFVMTIGKDGNVLKCEGMATQIQNLGFDPDEFATQMGPIFPTKELERG